MPTKFLFGAVITATLIGSAHAQVNNFPLMVGRWVHLSPEPGNTTPTGHQIIIAQDGSVFTSTNTVKGAMGRCTDAGANFCLEGVDGAERRFRSAYDIAFLAGPGNVVTALNFRLVRESAIVPCPHGVFNRTL
jgi:hypothetical protein